MIAVELNSGTIGYMEEWVYNLIWPIIERLPDELLYDLQCESQGSHEKYLELLGSALKDLPKWEDGYSPEGKFELRESVKEEGPYLGHVDEFVDAWEELLQKMCSVRDETSTPVAKRRLGKGIELDLFFSE